MSDTVRRSSAALASGTVVSRLLGFANISVLAIVLGVTKPGPNAFALANQLPTYVYAIVAGGLLSAVLVPHIVKSATQTDGGQAFVNRLVTLGVVAFLATTILATLAAPFIVRLYAIASNEGALADGGLDLAVSLAYWLPPADLLLRRLRARRRGAERSGRLRSRGLGACDQQHRHDRDTRRVRRPVRGEPRA